MAEIRNYLLLDQNNQENNKNTIQDSDDADTNSKTSYHCKWLLQLKNASKGRRSTSLPNIVLEEDSEGVQEKTNSSKQNSFISKENILKVKILNDWEKNLKVREANLFYREHILVKKEQDLAALETKLKMQLQPKMHQPFKIRENQQKREPKLQQEAKTVLKKLDKMLTRLTMDNCLQFSRQIESLIIKNTKSIQTIVDHIFDRIKLNSFDPNVYARLWQTLTTPQMETNLNNLLEGVTVKNLLLDKYDVKFDNISNLMNAGNKRQDEDRLRILKYIRFTGNLYKNGVIPSTVMIDYLQSLIHKDELTLECLSELLTNIGRNLEVTDHENLQTIFDIITDIVQIKHDDISENLRCTLQGLVDLRKPKHYLWMKEFDHKIMDAVLETVYVDTKNVLNEPVLFSCLLHGEPIHLVDSEGHCFRSNIKEILKGLCETNVEESVKKIQQIPFRKFHHLMNLVDILYNKAMKHPKCITLIIHICKQMASLQVPGNFKEVTDKMYFNDIFALKCRHEFKKTEIIPCNHNMKMDFTCSLKEYKTFVKIRLMRNVLLIGYLFVEKLIHVSVIKDLIDYLLESGTENNLERLCILLAIAGPCLEMNWQYDLSNCFSKLENIIEKHPEGFSKHIRNKIKDINQLRNPKWVRRVESAVQPVRPAYVAVEQPPVVHVNYHYHYNQSPIIYAFPPHMRNFIPIPQQVQTPFGLNMMGVPLKKNI